MPQRDILLEALAPLVEFEIGNEAIDAQVPYFGVRTPRYKYIHWSFGDEELYDLERDPYELENIADDPAASELRDKLAARAEELSRCVGSGCVVPGSGPVAEVDPITHRQVGQGVALVLLLALLAGLSAVVVRLVRTVRAR